MFLSSLALGSLLLTACGSPTPPAPQTLPVGNYDYETIVLNDAEIVSADHVVCIQQNVEVNCKNIDKNVMALLKKDWAGTASIQIRVLSPDSKLAEIKFVKAGNNKCPSWAAGLFTACECLESTINYLH